MTAGHDPDDLDAVLAAMAAEYDIDDLPTAEKRARWEAGEGLPELLDDRDSNDS